MASGEWFSWLFSRWYCPGSNCQYRHHRWRSVLLHFARHTSPLLSRRFLRHRWWLSTTHHPYRDHTVNYNWRKENRKKRKRMFKAILFLLCRPMLIAQRHIKACIAMQNSTLMNWKRLSETIYWDGMLQWCIGSWGIKLANCSVIWISLSNNKSISAKQFQKINMGLDKSQMKRSMSNCRNTVY